MDLSNNQGFNLNTLSNVFDTNNLMTYRVPNPIQAKSNLAVAAIGNNTPTTDSTKMKDMQSANSTSFMSGLGSVAELLSSFGGLANAYLGYQNYKLAKDQYATEKAFANRNLANSAELTNTAIDSAANLAYHLGGKSLTNASLNPSTQAAYMADANSRKVDGSAI